LAKSWEQLEKIIKRILLRMNNNKVHLLRDAVVIPYLPQSNWQDGYLG
jgi:hypothetical protein